MTQASPHFTQCGLPGIELVPFGMHACHFYEDPDELVWTLAQYLVQGLEANERCVWVTAPPLPAQAAADALRAAWGGVDEALRRGALRILDSDSWRTSSDRRPRDEVEPWLAEERRALAEGYSGLRIAGSTRLPAPDEWISFIAYAKAVTAGLDGRRIVALCSYAIDPCDRPRINEAVQAHHCAFERPGRDWQVAVPRIPEGAPSKW